MPEHKNTALRIEKLPRGGYAVLTSYPPDSYNCALAAFSDIDDALAFIKDEFDEPEKAEEKPGIVTTDVTAEVCERRAKERAQKYICTCFTISGQEHASYCPHSPDFEPGPARPTEVEAEKLPSLPERGTYRGIV